MAERIPVRTLVIFGVIAVAYLAASTDWRPAPAGSGPATAETAETAGREDAGEAEILRAVETRRSGFMVEASATVVKVLADDRDGSRHQRLIVRLASGATLLISHNIDLAPRVPAQQDDELRFRGQYEWNERGGVVHWTHADPQQRREGGWIRHRGRAYR